MNIDNGIAFDPMSAPCETDPRGQGHDASHRPSISQENEASLLALLESNQDECQPDETVVDVEMAVATLIDDPSLTQLVIRNQRDGVETLLAYFCLSVEPQQQVISWHVPFTPAFAHKPTCQAEAAHYPDARIRFTNVQRIGVRAELNLQGIEMNDDRVLVVMSFEAPAS